MNKKELIERLIEYYIECILCMPFFGWRQYCADKNILNGVCLTANTVFNTFIYGEEWVNRNKLYGMTFSDTKFMYWSPLPSHATTYFQAMWRLYYRVRILKKELKLTRE